MKAFFESGGSDVSSRGALAPQPSDYIDVRILAGNVVEKHTIPAGATHVVFSATANFYAKFGDTNVAATVPSADIIDGTASELNPSARRIPANAGFLSLVSSESCIVTIAWYGY